MGGHVTLAWQHKKRPAIGPLHDPVTWYKITYTGEQIAQWDFQNKGRCTVLEVPLRNLLTSIFNLAPCERVVQRAYYLSRHQSFEIIWVCPAVDLNEPAQIPGMSAAEQSCMAVSRSHIAWRMVLQHWPCYCLGNGTAQGRSWKRSAVRAETCHQTSRHPGRELEQSKNFENDILGVFERKQ